MTTIGGTSRRGVASGDQPPNAVATGANRGAVKIASLATILLSVQACAPVAPRSVAHERRASLDTVGVSSVGPVPDPSLAAPVGVGGQVLRGVGEGGGIGVLSGAAGGAVVSLVCGPFAPVCATVTIPVGAVTGLVGGSAIGGTVRGVHAIPADTAEGIRAALSGAAAGRDLPAEMRRRVVDGAGDPVGRIVDLGADAAAAVAPEHDVDAVLEIGITRIALSGKGGSDPDLVLVIDAEARLVGMPDRRELWHSARIAFESPKAKASAWTSDDSRLLKSELDRGLDVVARRIDDVTLRTLGFRAPTGTASSRDGVVGVDARHDGSDGGPTPAGAPGPSRRS